MIHFKLGKAVHIAAPAESEKEACDQLRIACDDLFLTRDKWQGYPSEIFHSVTMFQQKAPWTAGRWRQDALLRIQIRLAKWKFERATRVLRELKITDAPQAAHAHKINANKNAAVAAIEYRNLLNRMFVRNCIRSYNN